MSSSFFGTVIFFAPSVYSFSHGVDFFLDFFFGFSICFASFDRKRLYYVDVQKESLPPPVSNLLRAFIQTKSTYNTTETCWSRQCCLFVFVCTGSFLLSV